MPLIVSPRIAAKLKEKHNVSQREVEQCFLNIEGPLLEDDREDHQTDPLTQWFVAPTNAGRKLKISFVREGEDVYLKSAYEANQTWITKYEMESSKED